MNLLVLLLIALPACLAQFSIQGPSDGNRVAQGLRVEEGKGIQYTDQNDAGDSGFSIQGATVGNSQVQGASDGHSNYQIQGSQDSGVSRFNIQGPSVGAYNIQGATNANSQAVGTYDGSDAYTKSLQYNDPSGFRVNWRSYDRQVRPEPQQAQYVEPAAPRAPLRQRGHAVRQQPQPQPQHQPQPQPQQQPHAEPPPAPVRTYSTPTAFIKQLLQLQQQIPYQNVIPEPYRYDAESGARMQLEQVRNHYQELLNQQPAKPVVHTVEPARGPPRPPHRGAGRLPPPEHEHSRQRRQAPHQPQPQLRPQPQRLPPEPVYQYSRNIPPAIQDLLKFQEQIPNNIIANQITVQLDKPYVPHPVQPSAPIQQAAPQYQGQGVDAYQGQGVDAYQGQGIQAYQGQGVQAYQGQGIQQYQGQASGNSPLYGYQQASGGVRPVKENQY